MLVGNNIEHLGPAKTSPWRKIAIGTWSSCGDPSVYGSLDIDATPILKIIQEYKEKGIKITPTVVIAKAAAMSIKEYPSINSILRWSRPYQRKTIDVFLQVSNDDKNDDNLSGVLLRSCDEKSLLQITEELQVKTKRIKKGDDFEYKKMKSLMGLLPGFLIGPILKFMGFLLYDLNLWSPLFNTPRDSFGSVMVTSVGMLGIDSGFAPLVPYSRCPLLMAVGEISDRPVVENGQVVIKPMMTVSVTLDHRLIDGKGAAFMLKGFRRYVAQPV